jgi:hypothetical protein
MIYREMKFNPDMDWQDWDVDYLGELNKLYNQEFNGTYSESLEEKKYIIQASDGTVFIVVTINRKNIFVAVWNNPNKTNYTVLLDALNKRILIDKKERLYKCEPVKFFIKRNL